MNLLKLLNGLVSPASQDGSRVEQYRSLIRQEAKLGGQLFGAVAPNGRREFFCLDENTWVWHEEWIDQQGLRHAVTTRYDVRTNGILKAQDKRPYQYIGYDEAKRFYQAVSMYNKQVDTALYAA
ncbi:MAG: hypothetical protein ACQR33_05465 [Candidatus Saccharibacteria bacterium]